jgi:Methyltransferase FkbM domain
MTIRQRALLLARYKVQSSFWFNKRNRLNLSYGEFGVDRFVHELLPEVGRGFYVDVGAHHPVCWSNTYHFYRCGWRGINIDALPDSMTAFRTLRPRDINLEACLSTRDGAEVTYFMFEQPECNTVDSNVAEAVERRGIRLIYRKILPSRTLAACLDEYLPARTGIDFLSIDAEGMDEAILIAHDWDRYPASVVVFEKHDCSYGQVENLTVVKHMRRLGFEVAGKCGYNIVMHRRG